MAINGKTVVKFFSIDYETDGVKVKPPKHLTATLRELGWEEGDDVDDVICSSGADFISNTTGWLVNSFDYSY